MAQVEEIMKSLTSHNFLGLKERVAEFLEPAFSKKILPEQTLKNFKLFVIRFLNGIVSLTKTPKDINSAREILQASGICCDASLLAQREPSAYLKYSVPKHIYHILLKYEGQEYLEDVCKLSEKLFDLFQLEETQPIPSETIKMAHAVYAFLWNTAVKAAPKDSKGNELVYTQILMQLATSTKFLCLLPHHNLLVDRLMNVTTKCAEWIVKKYVLSQSVITDTCERILSVFNSVLNRLSWLCKTVESKELHLTHGRTLSQVRCIVIEWLIKMSMYDHAENLIQRLCEVEDTDMKSICDAVARMYSITMQSEKSMCGVTKGSLKDVTEALAAVNTIVIAMELENSVDLWLVHRAYSHLMQQLKTGYFDHYKGQFTIQSVHILTESCDIFASLCSQTIEQLNSVGENTQPYSLSTLGQDLENKKKPEYMDKLLAWRLSSNFKKLDLYKQVLPDTLGDGSHDICDLAIETAKAYADLLARDGPLLTDKMIQSESYSIGYICNSLSKSLFAIEDYKHAGPLLKISSYYLNLCDNPAALKQYEGCMECYRRQHLWLDASKVIVDMLFTGSKFTTSAISLWCKLKKDAIVNGEAMFTDLTLSSVVESSGVPADLTARDLLMLEYHSWRKQPRRELEVEYNLLTKLLDVSTSQVQKAELMVELSGNIFLTGRTYKDSTPGEMLNKAIIMLDKSSERNKAVLAIAHYRKYVISHEETLQNHCPLQMFEKENEVEEEGQENRPGTKQVTEEATFKYDTPYTLETEHSNLPYLTRALELWKSSFKTGAKRKSKEKDYSSSEVTLFDLDVHVDTMIACGTRLIAMKQPSFALEVLNVACEQIKKTSDKKQAFKLNVKTSHALMLLGRYEESEQLINTLVVDGETSEKLLLMAELFLLMGKKEKGMAVVQLILQAKPRGNMTPKICLVNGTAKRLLSMFLCFPDGHKMSPVNEDILSLATEAVKQHLTVLKVETKNEGESKGQDKWVLMFEFFQSLLHMCQLYRYTGLPRMATCYIKEGIKISQAQGLPRWSCEFMFEALQSESMQADGIRSLAAVNSIKSILNASSDGKSKDQNKDNKSSGSNIIEQQSGTMPTKTSCSGNALSKPSGGNVTPEKNVPEELDTTQREEISKLAIPECGCFAGKDGVKCDESMHRLYVKAGIVLSEFLSQYEMEPGVSRILSNLQSRYPNYVNCFDHSPGKYANECNEPQPVYHKQCFDTDGIDPHVKSLSLEAVCLQAELFLNQKKFEKVDMLWNTLKDLEKRGFWTNVIHSDILMTRVALCQASSFMFSIQSATDALMDSKVANTVDNMTDHFNDIQAIPSKKKVNFTEPLPEKLFENTTKVVEVDQENLCPIDVPVVTKKKSSSNSKSVLTPLKANNFQEPKNISDKLVGKLMLSSKKQKLNQVFGTPLTGRKAKLDFLMASDDEDDIVFPSLKPVTPKSVKSDKTRRVRSRKDTNSTDKTSVTEIESETRSLSITSMENPPADTEIAGEETSPSPAYPIKGGRKMRKNESKGKRSSRKITVDNNAENKHTPESNKQSENSTEANLNGQDVFVFDGFQSTKGIANSVNDSHGDDDSISFPTEKLVTPVKRKGTKVSTSKSRKAKRDTRSSVSREHDLSDSASNNLLISTSESDKQSSEISVQDDGTESTSKPKTACSFLNVRGKSITNSALKGSRRNTKNDEVENNAILELKGDVFDFDLTPDKPGIGKTKVKPAKSSKKITKGKVLESGLSKEKKEKTQVSKISESKLGSNSRTTRGRRNLRSDIETARTVEESVCVSTMEHLQNECSYQISLDVIKTKEDEADLSISELCCLEQLQSPIMSTEFDPDLSVVEVPKDDMIPSDNSIEPIEVMRGGARQKSKCKTKPTSIDKDCEERSDRKRTVSTDKEVVRSSCSVSMKDLMEKIAMDCPVNVSSQPETSTIETQTVQEEKMIKLLEELCGRIAHFAPYPQYPKMCQVLAAKYVDTNPQRAAFLLSESIAVSFRHYAAVVRGKNKSSSSPDQSTRMSRDAAMSENVPDTKENLHFDKDESSLQTMVDVIPPNWCVIQLSVITDLLNCQHFLLTRFLHGKAPVVIEIPAFSTPQGRHVLKNFENVMVQNRGFADITDKSEWWKKRTDLDTELQECIENMEKFWLGAWKGAFLPPICSETVITSVQKEIKKALKIDIDCNKLELILLSKSILTEAQLKTCIKGLNKAQCTEGDIDSITAIVKKCSLPDIELTSQHHVVLILDKSVQHLPWECIPILSERSVSRMPCLSHLYYQLSVICTKETSVYKKGVNPRSTFYIVNPGGDLAHTEEQFKDWFNGEEGWKGSCGTEPTKEQFIEAITDRDLLIYLGHGSGARYFPSGEIEKLQAHAVTILMGCSSGKLHVKGQLEPYGIMMSYFLAGCPCMVANLWDVTDKDIDKYTVELLKTWFAAEDGAHLVPFVQKARKACKMKYLVGSAPVVYGLPVFMNRENKQSCEII